MNKESLEEFEDFNQENLVQKNSLIGELRLFFKFMVGMDRYEEFCQKYFNMKPLVDIQDVINDASAIEAEKLENKYGDQKFYVYQHPNGQIEDLSHNYLNLLEIASLQFEEDCEQDNFTASEAYEILDYRDATSICDKDNLNEMYQFIDDNPDGKFRFKSSDTGEYIKDLRYVQTEVNNIEIELDD